MTILATENAIDVLIRAELGIEGNEVIVKLVPVEVKASSAFIEWRNRELSHEDREETLIGRTL